VTKDLDHPGPALSVKGNFSWGFQEQKTAKDKKAKDNENKKKKKVEEVATQKKTLGKFVQLRNLDIKVKRGEFVCIIGDVGSCKSSLLHAIIGDLIYVPDSDI
jgi:ABC-type polysaccharide/polyol phosphate transport system ATPase subunit